MSSQQNKLFESSSLDEYTMASSKEPVTCLGMDFPNEEARRAYFSEELRKKLQDPEFRKIEGFPIGEDEDILNLSDPPYYTACPNPWIANFIEEWEAEKPEKPEGYKYHREPFAADVSEGKNHPIYNAHSYHTKVPHRAIMRYILHYTEPGDIVFDGFCGTGMTGVAAQMCGDRDEVLALGYQVRDDGTILQQEVAADGKKVWVPFSKLGARKTILNDLSPAATFISYNYNTPIKENDFEENAKYILNKIEDNWGWMYETYHTDKATKGKINYTIWSDVFLCPECSEELIFWNIAVDKKNNKVKEIFNCHSCSSSLDKSRLLRSWSSFYDKNLGKVIKIAKQEPVLINYSVDGIKGRFEKKPDNYDLNIIEKTKEKNELKEIPTIPIPKSDKTGEPLRLGISHTHLFYTSRNFIALNKVFKEKNRLLSWKAHATALINSKMNRWPRQRGPLSLTLFVGSIVYENNVFRTLANRKFPVLTKNSNLNTTQSATHLLSNKDRLDYIFIDPPFGSNIYYSDLNILWESWLRLKTNINQEAIESRAQNKSSDDYRVLMRSACENAYAMLKPGRWMTVEFSNTKSSIWNGIQTAITDAGFIVANVSALDKKQGSFNAVTNTTSVKQDLVISAYKPNGGFEKRFEKEALTEDGVWSFVRTHLKYLPVTKLQGIVMQFIPERDARILFDQMVAYYVRKGYPVPISSPEFQLGLAQHFIERDGMYFLPEQVAEYDRKKMLSGEVQQASLFVSDESSAIDWLRQLLKQKPQTFSDLNPQFMQQLGGWNKNEAQLDLRELLNQNFLSYDGSGLVPEQIHAYLSTNWKEMRNLAKDDSNLVAKAKDRWYVPDPNKAGDLEKLRERALLKEFDEYKQRKNKFKRNEKFRLEAVRAGFKKAWQERDYAVIIEVADKLPTSVLEEDPKLLMWYDQAVTRMEG